MPRYNSNIKWFDEEQFLGSIITFPGSSQPTWKLERKIIEHEFCEDEEDAKEPGMASEARAVFVCSSLGQSSPKEAIVKIRMQIPYRDTFGKSLSERAKQATDTPTYLASNEIEALQILTAARCSSTPALLAFKQEKQTWDSWVPGGYVLYILMEKLPGITVSDVFWNLPPKEREELRQSFKNAWTEVFSCGIIPGDCGSKNLLWDRDSKRCYLVDFEIWYRPSKNKRTPQGFYNSLYIAFHLAMVLEGDNYDDMSTWVL